jgi:signal transduction histidine kinase
VNVVEPNRRRVPILLVDDTEANLLALEAVLASLEVQAVTARSGREALAHIEHEAFAVALVDVQMPGMDGFELLRRLRETRNGRELPVVFVTAVHRNEEYAEKGYSLGGADYITKPYDPRIVRARVKAFIDLYRQREAVNHGQMVLRTQERDEAVRRLVAFERIASAALASNDLNALLAELLATFVDAADNADSATILLREGEFLRAAASVGFRQEASGDGRIRIGQGFAGLIAEERRALELNDDAISNVVLSPILRDRGLRALYGTPLLHDGQLLGVAYIGSSRAARFSEAETRLFLAAADRASLAIAKRLEISQLSEVLRAAPALIAIVGATDGRYSFVNAPMQSLFGETLLGVSHERRGFGPGAAEAIARAGREARTAELAEVQIPPEMLPARAEALFVRFTAQPMRDATDNVDRVLLFATDVTAGVYARRELEVAEKARAELLERERAARRAAEVASNAKDEFLATISHELRTPLNSILGWATLARSRPAVEVERALSVIERNARAQARIVEDVLDFARMSKGKLQLSLHNVALKEVISAALESVRPAAEIKKLELELELHLDYPVLGDAERLQQVVWNLMSNAVKYTGVGGRIRVSAMSNAEGTRFSVQDSGQGIAPDFLPYVFEPFRQADGTTTRRHGGLGLGLSIVRQIVDAHGGSIRAESAGLGQGATFIVELPSAFRGEAVSEEAPSVPDPASDTLRVEKAPLKGLRILLVDDDDDSRELMADTLRLNGAEILESSSSEAALCELERTRPHVLVSDIAMPVLDGYELLRRVRALPLTHGGATPALAVTAYTGAEVVERVLQGGFQRYVAKPIDIQQFVSAVAELAQLGVPLLRQETQSDAS